MRTNLRTKALFFALLCCSSFAWGQELPWVEEQVDEMILITVSGESYERVVFVKNGSVLTSRMVSDDMVWSHDAELFQLVWRDQFFVNRVVRANRLSVMCCEQDVIQQNRSGPWWAMHRNMRDLKLPDR